MLFLLNILATNDNILLNNQNPILITPSIELETETNELSKSDSKQLIEESSSSLPPYFSFHLNDSDLEDSGDGIPYNIINNDDLLFNRLEEKVNKLHRNFSKINNDIESIQDILITRKCCINSSKSNLNQIEDNSNIKIGDNSNIKNNQNVREQPIHNEGDEQFKLSYIEINNEEVPLNSNSIVKQSDGYLFENRDGKKKKSPHFF